MSLSLSVDARTKLSVQNFGFWKGGRTDGEGGREGGKTTLFLPKHNTCRTMTLEKSLDARKSEINVVYFNRNLCMATAERGGDFLFLRMASRGDVLTSRRKPFLRQY